MAKKLSKQATATVDFNLSDDDEVFGTIRWDEANKQHVVLIELRGKNDHRGPGSTTKTLLLNNVVADGVLTQNKLDKFLELWRELRDAAALSEGFV
jgi:hypothetical protein